MAELDDGPGTPPLGFACYLILGMKSKNLGVGRGGQGRDGDAMTR